MRWPEKRFWDALGFPTTGDRDDFTVEIGPMGWALIALVLALIGAIVRALVA